MAAAFSSIDSERLQDRDYSVSHRTPPPIPYPQQHRPQARTSSHAAAGSVDVPNQRNAAVDVKDPSTQAAVHGNNSVAERPGSSGRRRSSLSNFLLRRTPSTSSTARLQNDSGVDSSVPPVPQLPNTRISHAHAEAATRRSRSQSRSRSRSENVAERQEASFSMLRKVSSRSKAKLREAAEGAAAPRQAPHLPLPSFTEDERPDSIAIFNTAYTHSTSSDSSPPQPRTTANFSRPAMVPSSNNKTINSSSSPAYAARSADAPLNSSSPAVVPKANGEYVANPATDRIQSMTNRGRYSYASSVGQVNSIDSPRRVRRRKDPTPFNVLVVGAKNSGKTSFISFLRHSLALPAHKQPSDYQPDHQIGGNRSSFRSDYVEAEIDGERVGLTLWDSAGLERNLVDLQLRELTAFVEAKFEDTFVEEQKVMRSPGVKDTHIHCVFLVLDPVRLDSTIAESSAFQNNGSHTGSLDEHLDLQVMRALWGKTTVIPVISKADTLTVNHMAFLKRAAWEALKSANLNPLGALELEEDEEDEDEDEDDDGIVSPSKEKKGHKRQSSLSAAALTSDDEAPYIPMSVLSPDIYDLPPYVSASKAAKPDKVGRKFPWGFADPYNPEHCDFGRFRDSIFSEWRSDLRELSRTRWYENWRTSRLQNLPGARQRVKGGVTPVAAVPKEGRSASGSRQFSAQHGAPSAPSNSSLAAGSTIPRSVSTATNTNAAISPSNGEAMRDFSGSSQMGSVRGGTYRGVNSHN